MVRKIVVLPHNPLWPVQFRQEADRLSSMFGDEIVAIHHFGSTSIPDIYAKPIIDILVEVRDIEKIDAANERMLQSGYIPKGEFGIPGRRFFIKGDEDNRTHHIHFYLAGHPEVQRHLNFRDYIIAHPQEAQAYSRLKIELARLFPEDIDGYNRGKDKFIKDIDQKAKTWISERREQFISKDELIQKIEIGSQALINLARRIPREAAEQLGVFETWSVKDIFTHINYWQKTLLQVISAAMNHQPLPQVDADLDSTNEQAVLAGRSQPLEEVFLEFEKQVHEIIQFIRELPQSDLITAGLFWSVDQEPLWRSIASETYEHYAEHLDQIQAWWSAKTPKNASQQG